MHCEAEALENIYLHSSDIQIPQINTAECQQHDSLWGWRGVLTCGVCAVHLVRGVGCDMTPGNWESALFCIWLFLSFPIWKPPCYPLHILSFPLKIRVCFR